MKITKPEKQLLEWLSRNLSLLVVLAASILGIGLRLSVRNILSGDAIYFLLPWYAQIQNAGGLAALDTQVGNYNLLYQTLIALMTYLPIAPLHAYKLLSCLFDYALAITVAAILKPLAPRHKNFLAVTGYCLVLLDPLVWLNSAAWAQCDAIYSFFVLTALALLLKNRVTTSFVFLGLAFAFKLQAVFALPFFLAIWFCRRDFSLVNFLWIPAIMLLTGLPAILQGRNPLDVFTIYLGQVAEYPQLFLNYPSFWVLFDGLGQSGYYEAFQGAALFFTIGILLLWIWLWLRQQRECTGLRCLYLFFILNYSCVLFLPAMHERYGYLYEVTAILLALLDRRSLGLLAGLTGLSIITYCSFLFSWQAIAMPYLALGNCCIYLLYCRHIHIVAFSPCKTPTPMLQ